MEFSRPEYGVGSLSLLQGIFPTQGSNPGLLPCRQILYQLSHKGSPSTWVNPGTKDTVVECSHERILGPEQPLHLIPPIPEACRHVPPLLCVGRGQVGPVTRTEDTGPWRCSWAPATPQATQGSKFISILKVSHCGGEKKPVRNHL